MQTQLLFMDNVNEYVFVEAPKGALCSRKTGTNGLDKEKEAFFDALQGITGDEPLPSDSGPVSMHIDMMGGSGKTPEMRAFEEIDKGTAIETQGHPGVEMIDAGPGLHIQEAVVTANLTDYGIDGAVRPEPAVEQKNKLQPPPTLKTGGLPAAGPIVNTAAGTGNTGTITQTGGVENGENINAASRQPVETETSQGQAPHSSRPTHDRTQYRQSETPVFGKPADWEIISGQTTTKQGSAAVNHGNRKGAISTNVQPVDVKPTNVQPVDGQPVNVGFSSASEAPGEPISHGKGIEPSVGDSIQGLKDPGRISPGPVSSGEPAELRESTAAASGIKIDGPRADTRIDAMSWSRLDRVEDQKETQPAGGENKPGLKPHTQQPFKDLTENNRSMVPASAPSVDESESRRFMPSAAGPTGNSVEMKPVSEPASAQQPDGQESSRRNLFSFLPTGELTVKGDGEARNDQRFTHKKTDRGTTLGSPDRPKIISSDERSHGFAQKNETDNSRQNGQALFDRYALESSVSTAKQQGQGSPALFSPGEVTAEAAAGRETVPSEGSNPPDGTTAINSLDTGRSEQAGLRFNETQGRSGADLPDFFSKIVDRAVMTLKSGQSEMKMMLKPEFLGQVRMQVLTENQHVMVKIIVETQVVKEVIENNLGQLKGDLQSHGLEVDKFDVMTSHDSHRDGQNPRHLHSYRSGSKTGDRTSQDTPESAPGKQVPNRNTIDDSGKIDFFA